MKKLYAVIVLLAFFGICVASNDAFAQTGDQEEIDFLLFLPNSDNQFADDAQAMTHLDTVAHYLKGRDILPGRIYVYGYAADVANEIDPILLSKNRALFVMQELQKRGIANNLFADPVGYGHVDLWGDNTDEPDRSPNRRVRILVENIILTPAIVAEPEVIIEPVETAEPAETVKVTPPPKPTEEPPYSLPFPWWLLLLPLLLIPVILLASKHKKNAPAKPAPVIAQKTEPQKVEPPPVIVPKAEPPKVEPQPVIVPKAEPSKVEPIPVSVQKTEPPKVEPQPVIVPKAELSKVEPQKAEPIPFFAKKAEPPKEKIKVLGEEEIRLYSYGLYDRRYGQNASAVEDWYQSICELSAHYEALGYRVILYWEPEAQTIPQTPPTNYP
jgi:hypothetical protein